jgi:hypothetical protein
VPEHGHGARHFADFVTSLRPRNGDGCVGFRQFAECTDHAREGSRNSSRYRDQEDDNAAGRGQDEERDRHPDGLIGSSSGRPWLVFDNRQEPLLRLGQELGRPRSMPATALSPAALSKLWSLNS